MTPSEILAAAGAPTWEEIQAAHHVLRKAEQAMRNLIITLTGQGYHALARETFGTMAGCGLPLDVAAGYLTPVTTAQ